MIFAFGSFKSFTYSLNNIKSQILENKLNSKQKQTCNLNKYKFNHCKKRREDLTQYLIKMHYISSVYYVLKICILKFVIINVI